METKTTEAEAEITIEVNDSPQTKPIPNNKRENEEGEGNTDADTVNVNASHNPTLEELNTEMESTAEAEQFPSTSTATANNENGSSRREKRNWALTDYETFKKFENEAEFNEWFVGDGADWIIESNRDTKRHHVTECLCRFSYKYSSRRIPDTPYNCTARLRVLRALDSMDENQKIVVEIGQTAHNHEPHELMEGETMVEFRQRSASNESKKSIGGMSNKSKGESEGGSDSMAEEISPEIEEYIREKYTNFGWSSGAIQRAMMADRMKAPSCKQIQQVIDGFGQNKCIELLEKKKTTDMKISQKASLIADLGKALEEEMKQAEAEEKHSIGTGPGTSVESDLDTDKMHSPTPQGPTTRARRSKRVYSPSPPSSLVVEPGRKRKKERTESIEDTVPLPVHQDVPANPSFKWAKTRPSISLSSSLDSTGLTTAKEKLVVTIKKPQQHQQKQQEQPSNTKSADQTANAQLIRQNEKLTRQNVQLKQKNQEQHNQIQQLIGANRELIWAFNESRREHDELMKQLQMMVQQAKEPEVPKNNNVAQQNQQNAKGGRQRRISGKRAAKATGTVRAKKGNQRTKMALVTENALPPSLAFLKQQGIVQSITSESLEENQGGGHEVSKPSKIKIKKETPQVDSREFELNKIKQQLNHIKPDPDINKFIGTRKPAFYTPKDFGDWRSTMSSVLRKQIVLQLFEALCPEFIRENVVELAKQNPQKGDFIQRSLNFAYDTENEIFIGANIRDAYFVGVAEKILTLREAICQEQRKKTKKYSGEGGGGEDGEEFGAGRRNGGKRTLADVLKKKAKSGSGSGNGSSPAAKGSD